MKLLNCPIANIYTGYYSPVCMTSYPCSYSYPIFFSKLLSTTDSELDYVSSRYASKKKKKIIKLNLNNIQTQI